MQGDERSPPHQRIKVVCLRGVDRHADAASLRVHAERRLQQVIHLLGDLQIKPRETVRKDYLHLQSALSCDEIPARCSARTRLR